MGDDELLAENADLADAVEEMERELRRLRAEAQSRAQDTTRLVAENDALSAENEALIEDLLRHRSSAAEVHARESRLQAALETQAATAAELQTELHKANAKAADMRESICKLERENFEFRRMVDACQEIAADVKMTILARGSGVLITQRQLGALMALLCPSSASSVAPGL